MFDYLIEKDKELFIFLNNLGNPNWDAFWLFVTNERSFIPFYLFIIIITFWKLGIKRTLLVLLIVVALVTTTDQTSNLFKFGFERLRPCHDADVQNLVRLVKNSCGGKYTFFSAHASNTMGIAIFFSLLLKPYFKYFSIVLIAWALLVAYSRVYIGVHFPLDVLTGAFIGGFFGFLYYQLTRIIFRKIRA